VQIGGSDQWGNIVAGVDLIRRKENKTAYALTIPIVTEKTTGKKFGKSEGNAVWLDPEKTSPFSFYQFWFNTSDESVGDYLKLFTLLSGLEIAASLEMHRRDTKRRQAQQLLAREVTTLVHSAEKAEEAERISQILFGDASVSELDTAGTSALRAVAPSCAIHEGDAIVDVLIAAQLASSKREARLFLSDGAVTLSGNQVDESYVAAQNDFHNGIAILKRGKRNVCVLVLA
jgi:tyrosyl-tRNA synthetase